MNPVQGMDNVLMAETANWLEHVCIVQGFHRCLEATVEFEYVYQLISILFLRQGITVNFEHTCSDKSLHCQS